jgi:hypothetical protein
MAGDRPDFLQLDGSRVDLVKVVGGLRHLDASGEPSRVFAGLAAVCVPELCDECVVWISEQGQHPYRIRRASGAVPPGRPAILDGMLTATSSGGTTILNGSPTGAASVEISDHAVIARFVNPPFFGGPEYCGVIVCRWYTAHRPDDAEAALVGIMVDHATALVQRERTAGAGPPDQAQSTGSALTAAHRIAAASGILIGLYHLSPRQARQLLARASENTHRPVIDIADTVLRTGALPVDRPDRDTAAAKRSAEEPTTRPPRHCPPVLTPQITAG